MKHLALLLPVLTGCIDFEGARQSYCVGSRRPDLCFPLRDGGGGDGDTLTAEPAMPGQIAWGRRCGGPGDELPRAVAVTSGGDVWVAGAFTGSADLCTGPIEAAGGKDLFLARYSPTGEAQQLITARGPGDEEATGVAVAGDALLVGGVFGAPVSLLGAGPFDAGVSAAEGFVARVSAGQVTHWLQLSSGAGGTSRVSRVAVYQPGAAAADQRVVAAGTFRGDLTVAGTALGARTRDTAFLLVFDGNLALRTWTLASPECQASSVDDFAFDANAFAHVFSRLQSTVTGCSFGTLGGGLVLPAMTPVTFTVWLQATGAQDGNGVSLLTASSVPSFPLVGTYAEGDVLAVTEGESRGNLDLHFPSGVYSIAATDARGHALTSRQGFVLGAIAYRGMTGSFLGRQLPERTALSPCFFSTEPGSPVWVKPFTSTGGEATTRGVATASDGALIAAGDFAGSLGTHLEDLVSRGGADLFLLRFHP